MPAIGINLTPATWAVAFGKSGMDYMTKADFIFHTAYESINALRQFYMKRWLTFFYTNSECIKSPYQYRQWFAFSMLCFNYLEYF